MGLFQKACETFDTFQDMVGKQIEGQEPLAPCSHSVTRADLEITIDRDGRFVAARAVDKKEPKIIIPVTEESAGRTSGIYAHPLCDQIKYIAPYDEQRHSQYVDGLKSWANSEFSHPKLLPILNYVERESILPDLVSTGLIHLDDKGLPDKEKLLIRWRIIGLGEQSGGTWEDLTLFETFRCYYQYKKTQADRVLCMVSGTEVLPAQQHPKGVVALNGNAKLVSENDKDNFTFRGRFTKPDQAATVGYEASQKAHNALRWVIANEGAAMGGRMFVCWSPQGVLLPKPHNPFFSSQTDDPPTPSAYQKQLKETLDGYKSSLDGITTEAVLAAFDAATSGRLSLTYYNQLQASDFLERLYQWDRICCWKHKTFGVSAPTLYQIVSCTFGTQRGDRDGFETDDRVIRQQMQRMLACRIDMGQFPADYIGVLRQRASTPLAYSKENREKILFTACATIRKFLYDKTKEEWSMALESQKQDRSYQYGRLLAVLEKAERDTYDDNEKREPNAIRMQAYFSQRPQQTAKTVWEQVKKAYYPQLKPASRMYYERIIGDIMEMLSQFPAEELNHPLSETYLLGYYLQRNHLYQKKEKKQEENDHERTSE